MCSANLPTHHGNSKQLEVSSQKSRKENCLGSEDGKKKQQTRDRVKKFSKKRKQTRYSLGVDDCDSDAAKFTNKMGASRAAQQVTKSLPETPSKRAEIIQRISASPRTRKHLVKAGIFKTPKEQKKKQSL